MPSQKVRNKTKNSLCLKFLSPDFDRNLRVIILILYWRSCQAEHQTEHERT